MFINKEININMQLS